MKRGTLWFGMLMAVCIANPLTKTAAQTPQLRVSPSSTNEIQIEWNSQSGTNYQVLATTNINAFALWEPASAPITATGTNTVVLDSTTNGATVFYKVHVLDEQAGLPTVRILSITNTQTVSGMLTVSVAAQDDSRLSAVTLYLDDVPVGDISEGDLNFKVNTAHYTNGTHTFVARALDNVGIAELGGTENNLVVVNEASSTPVTVTFQNDVRWPEAETLFETEVPIEVESDIYPAFWTVRVRNQANSLVRLFSGTTSNGVIQTVWDGNDSNSNSVPANAVYSITVTATAMPPAPGIVSAVASSGTVQTIVFREVQFTSAKIVLSRQKYRGVLVGAIFNIDLATMLNQVVIFIDDATEEVGNNRGVLNSTVFVCEAAGNYTTLSNYLKQSDVRGFYYHGHSNGKAIGFSEFTPNEGLTQKNIASGLGNSHTTTNGQQVYMFQKPFRFVFMDGCLSGRGNLPEAFGIPKAVKGSQYAPTARRAYMGWGSNTQNSLTNDDFMEWTSKFMESWIGTPSRPISTAVTIAYTAYPIQDRAPLDIYGSQTLTWAD